jgi:hypothetical protein
MDKPSTRFENRSRRSRTVGAALAFVMTLLIAAGVDLLAQVSPDDTLAQAQNTTDRRG